MGGRGRSRVDTKLPTAKGGGGDALHWGKRRGGDRWGMGVGVKIPTLTDKPKYTRTHKCTINRRDLSERCMVCTVFFSIFEMAGGTVMF